MACYFYRFSAIKWWLIRGFFEKSKQCANCIGVKSLDDAKSKGISQGDKLYFWNLKITDQNLIAWAREQGIGVFFVEDGFIRSLGLGSAMSRPLSLVMDSRGIYFDPRSPSDLEHILEYHDFDAETLARSVALVAKVQALKLSKYNHQLDQNLIIQARAEQKIILVPGQVDDDMSVQFGAFGLDNMTLLQKVREARPNDYIIYKPHPDVLSKNRIGDLPDEVPLQFADLIVRDAGIDSVLAQVHEVHTMTSLVGFEGLIRGKQVYTYGLPFYAGWGLTHDLHSCERRTRKRNINELAAAAFIEYPQYFHPKTHQKATPEEVMEFIALEKEKLKTKPLKRFLLNVQGQLLPRIRNFIKRFK